jgi:hypothetical protein
MRPFFAVITLAVAVAAAPPARVPAAIVDLALHYPQPDTVYPPNLAPPPWRWSGGEPPWAVGVAVGEGAPEWIAEVTEPVFVPPQPLWRSWLAQDDPVRVVVRAADGAEAEAGFRASPHPLQGTLSYRLVRAPFGSDPLFRTRLMQREPDGLEPTELIDGLAPSPCQGCHAIAAGGHRAALQLRDPYDPRVALADLPGDALQALDVPTEPFGRCSGLTWTPDGDLLVAMNLQWTEQRAPEPFALVNHAADLARVEPDTGRWQPVAGASDPRVVEDFPAVSPDGTTLAFVRGEVLATGAGALDIYTVPLDGSAPASPLAGASNDGRASYFPRYSPDGRWIAFVRSDGGYFARPSSDLYLVPAAGGEARALAINTSGRMDSWPAWSLDGHWLVWASRRDDPDRTTLYLTGVGPDGRCSPTIALPTDGTTYSFNHPAFHGSSAMP